MADEEDEGWIRAGFGMGHVSLLCFGRLGLCLRTCPSIATPLEMSTIPS